MCMNFKIFGKEFILNVVWNIELIVKIFKCLDIICNFIVRV